MDSCVSFDVMGGGAGLGERTTGGAPRGARGVANQTRPAGVYRADRTVWFQRNSSAIFCSAGV